MIPTEVPQDEVNSAVNCSQVSIAPDMVRDAARRQLCGADSKTYVHHGLVRHPKWYWYVLVLYETLPQL